MKLATKEAIRHALKPRERRRYQRVKIDVSGRYMLGDKNEYGCTVVDMSPAGLSMNAPAIGEVGEHVIAYIDILAGLKAPLLVLSRVDLR